MSVRLLVVEDESAIRQMLSFALQSSGMEMLEASTAEQASSILKRLSDEQQRLPDLVLLDWMLPGASGIEFARRLRKSDKTAEIPIIMLTARSDEDDRVRGLDSGVDDYVCKPFSPRELIARIHAVLRRQGKGQAEALTVGRIRLDLKSHRVSIEGHEVHLGPTEFKLLHYLMEHADRVFNRNQLLDAVWGQQVVVEDRTVDVHIRRLRKALNSFGADAQVQTVRGAGYRLSHG